MSNNSFTELDLNLEQQTLIKHPKSTDNEDEDKEQKNNDKPTPQINLNFSSLIKGVYLLILAVMGNFLAETLGCKTQKLLSNNMFIKQLLIIVMIYFAISFDSSSNEIPSKRIGQSFLIWILFILFTKMNLPFTYVAFILLTVAYIVNDYINYYKSEDPKKNAELIENYKNIFHNLIKVIVVIIIAGSSIYSFKQYNDHKSNFSLFKFVFGVLKCDSSK